LKLKIESVMLFNMPDIDVINTVSKQTTSMSKKNIIIPIVAVIVLGALTGFGLARVKGSTQQATTTTTTTDATDANAPKSAGVKDKSVFKDNAEGIMKKGGIEGESAYHLERPGGVSQNVYLTSTTVDLSLFENKKVKVYGQTINSDKAGWFMDVGAIDVK
jgi:hypothetical protein